MLDLKPRIISYSEIIKTVNETNTAYSIDFTVRYVGSDFLRVGVREEYSPSLIMQTIEEPLVAHVHRSSINAFNYAWVWLHVYNEYGEDEITITLKNLIGDSDITGVQTIHSDFVNASIIKIYTKEGKYMMQITNWDDLKELNQEIYILQLCNKDGIPFAIDTKEMGGNVTKVFGRKLAQECTGTIEIWSRGVPYDQRGFATVRL